MILPKSMIAPFAVLVTLATTTLAFTLGVGDAPARFLGDDDIVLLGPPGGIPGQASVDVALVPPLRGIEGVVAASPEVYVLTTLQGRSLFVRGVEFDAFLAVDDARLGEGRLPAGAQEALAGRGALETFDLELGSVVLVGSSFLRYAVPVTIVGVLEASTAARDEIVVPLATARGLADVPAGQAHMIRARSTDVEGLRDLFESPVPEFTYSEITISDQDVVGGETIVVSGKVTNWGRYGGTKQVEVHVSGSAPVTKNVYVDGRRTASFEVTLVMQGSGYKNVSINPEFEVRVRPATLQFLSPPAVAALGWPIEVRVALLNDAPARDIRVMGPGIDARTDENGVATITPAVAGRIKVYAYEGDEPRAAMSIDVREIATEPEARFVLESVRTASDVLPNDAPFTVEAEFANVGLAGGTRTITFAIDRNESWNSSLTLEAGRRRSVTFEVGPLAPGDHVLEFVGLGQLDVRVYGGADPRVAAFLDRAAPAEDPARSLVASDGADEYIVRVVGDIRGVVMALAFLSALLTTIGLLFVLMRHLAEAEPRIGIYRALGATNARVSAIVEREVGMLMAAGAAIGIAMGIIVARSIASTELVRAFGHSIEIVASPTLVALVFILAIGVAVLAAKGILAYSLRTPLDHLLRGSSLRPLPAEAPPLAEIIGERP